MTIPPQTRAALAASPTAFLVAISFTNWLGFAGWQALFNNFAKEAAGFTGWEIGILQSVREIPGFLAFTAVIWFMLMREQLVAYVSLALLAFGIAITGGFPSFWGLLITTFVMSAGFHYFETAHQALSLQLLPKSQAPRVLGRIASTAAAAQLVAYGLIAVVFWLWQPSYGTLYLGFGIVTLALAGAAALFFRSFRGSVPQHKGIVLRRRYWLYYVLTFLSGARRQLFMAFGGWLLVERFGYTLADFSMLLFAYCAINLFAGPLFGRLIQAIGERATIILENLSLVGVFIGYSTTASGLVAGLLFVVDGVFFTLIIAQRTYFQKISDPADIAPTASVAFTINHIAAVVIPVVFGKLWIEDPTLVFMIGAMIATASLGLAFLVPRHPEPGQETILRPVGRPVPAE
ncbi:MFS transporter [Microvirga massiliensis]|uniref:MFS transporter n=1 Tax=Microvirga massiliensis TaxID=1033741 RepID=UPI00062BB2F6|nr:MFS transporter [Microvirga massiliensis]